MFILEDTSSKPVKDEPSCPGESVATTQSGSGSAHSSGLKSRPPLKKLTIPLKALSSLAPQHRVLAEKRPISAATPRWVKKQLLNIVIQSGCGSFFCHKLKNQIWMYSGTAHYLTGFLHVGSSIIRYGTGQRDCSIARTCILQAVFRRLVHACKICENAGVIACSRCNIACKIQAVFRHSFNSWSAFTVHWQKFWQPVSEVRLRFPKFAMNLAISLRICQSKLGNEVVNFTPNFVGKLTSSTSVHCERSSCHSVKLSWNFLRRCGYVD